MRFRDQQLGLVVLGILVAMLFLGVASVALIWRTDMQRAERYISEGAGLMQVRNGLQKYAKINKDTFAQGKTVMYINDQFAPTIEELTKLGYFTSTGIDTNPFGASYKTQVTRKSDGSITGMVYITGSVTNSAGVVDSQRACGIAKALGDIGLCTNPVNSSMLGNRTTQIANPTGLKAVVGALIYVSP